MCSRVAEGAMPKNDGATAVFICRSGVGGGVGPGFTTWALARVEWAGGDRLWAATGSG